MKAAVVLLIALDAARPATAGAGWCLLTPPVMDVKPADAEGAGGAFSVDATRPYWQWNQKTAFDAAKECEAALAEQRQKYPLRTTGRPLEMAMGHQGGRDVRVRAEDAQVHRL
jgi:hypothetical protein